MQMIRLLTILFLFFSFTLFVVWAAVASLPETPPPRIPVPRQIGLTFPVGDYNLKQINMSTFHMVDKKDDGLIYVFKLVEIRAKQ